MEPNELIFDLLKGDKRRIDTSWKTYKMVGYTIKYKNVTLIRIDIHNAKQKRLEV
jgi:hypothetical protein